MLEDNVKFMGLKTDPNFHIKTGFVNEGRVSCYTKLRSITDGGAYEHYQYDHYQCSSKLRSNGGDTIRVFSLKMLRLFFFF